MTKSCALRAPARDEFLIRRYRMTTAAAIPLTLGDFLAEVRDELAAAVLRAWPPAYALEAGTPFTDAIGRLRRQPLGAQFHVAAALTRTLRQHRGALLVGEPSAGKSMTALCAAAMLGARRVLVLAPAHLLGKRGKWAREILQTFGDVPIVELVRLADIDRVAAIPASPERPFFVLLSRDRAKLGAPWWHVAGEHYVGKDGRRVPLVDGAERLPIVARTDAGDPVVGFHCGNCGRELADIPTAAEAKRGKTVRRWTREDFRDAPRRCPFCGEMLCCQQRLPGGRAMYPLSRYLARRWRGLFDLVIADEIHDYKGSGTAQGMMLGTLARAARYTLGITATLMSGRASSLFYLLHRVSPTFRAEFGYRELGPFVQQYGLVERTREEFEEIVVNGSGKQTKRCTTRTTSRELPGVSPAILTHLLDRACFLHLPDLGVDLPPYRELAVEVAMTPEQADAYGRFLADLRGEVGRAYRGRNVKLLGGYLQALLNWPDAPWRGDAVRDPQTGELVATAPALAEGLVYPKERALVDLVRQEAASGRKVLVYCTHTGTRDLMERLATVLADAGIRAAVLRANTNPRARERWLRARVREADCVLTSPRLVGSGLDLIEFSTLVWIEPEYSTYIVRQASRRTWRIGQRERVAVHFLVYRDTLQADALALVARGILAASMVDGEITPDGRLAAYDSRGELLLQLARTVIDGSARQDLGDLLRQASEAERAQAAMLGDGAWAQPAITAPTPEPVRARSLRQFAAAAHAEQLDLFGRTFG